MRIAIMVNNLHFGGAQRIMAELSVHLSGQGHEVYLFLMDDSGVAYPYGGEIRKISLYAGKYSFLATLLTWQYPIMTHHFKKRLRIDAAISAMEFLNFINLFTKRNEKVIPSMHNYRLQSEVTPTFKEKLVEMLFSHLSKRAFKLVTVAEAIGSRARQLYDLPSQDIVTIYNSSDKQHIHGLSGQPVPVEIASFMTPLTFCWMGRMTAQKSIDRLLVAFAEAATRLPDARLVLIGDGRLRKKIETLTEKLMISDRVHITGFIKNPFNIMAACRAFVLSSSYEGFGNVIVEAMCCGIPVISCDCLCGPREILSPETKSSAGHAQGVECREFGILTPPPNIRFSGMSCTASDALAEAMIRIARDDELFHRYSLASEKRSSDFTPDKIYPRWDAILCSEHRPDNDIRYNIHSMERS